MKYLRWQFTVSFFAGICGAAMAAESTNQAVLVYTGRPDYELRSSIRSDQFELRFFQEVVNSDDVVFDRFTGPSARMAWERRLNRLGYAGIARFNRDGAALFTAIAFDSLRTAAIEALPLNDWEDTWRGKLVNLIIGTVGNPLEERVSLTSISYSAVRDTWELSNDKSGIQWGFRPWRTSPYAYVLAHAGRFEGQPLIVFEGRAGYGLMGGSKMQSRLSLQLPAAFRLAAAADFDPARFGSNGNGRPRIGISLERPIRRRNGVTEGVLFVGFRSGSNNTMPEARHENILLAGLSREW
jgi:hypothetical protein